MVLICPYCDIEISEKLVEAEDGCCPECGTLITANSVIDEYDEDGDEYEEDEFANEFADDDYEEDEYADFDFEDFEEEKDPKENKKSK
ncbi:MAG: hypothetical protein J6W81_00355 [Lentisphaeria bacterium]|nr:hypothetical protein [Lentisphaeria bacterium]